MVNTVNTLVADDDQDTRDALRFLLEDAGYTVTETADGLQTLKVLRKSNRPMVVLLDLDLPRVAGIEVLRTIAGDTQLAARYAFLLLTAVSCTRYETANDICVALSVPLILKPFDLDVLLDAVATAARRVSSIGRV